MHDCVLVEVGKSFERLRENIPVVVFSEVHPNRCRLLLQGCPVTTVVCVTDHIKTGRVLKDVVAGRNVWGRIHLLHMMHLFLKLLDASRIRIGPVICLQDDLVESRMSNKPSLSLPTMRQNLHKRKASLLRCLRFHCLQRCKAHLVTPFCNAVFHAPISFSLVENSVAVKIKLLKGHRKVSKGVTRHSNHLLDCSDQNSHIPQAETSSFLATDCFPDFLKRSLQL
mmetsp:Transcript_31240/g.56667  ORF Transcript_31240/g.56667 Transcript_31240/m.56667 type:complete len:225 (+) Transcript_31240:832-1506(+)